VNREDDQLAAVPGLVFALPVSLALWCVLLVLIGVAA
jgi:hypothetical protein